MILFLFTEFSSWSIIYNKGYQKFETVSSTVTTKVKGLGHTIDSENETMGIKFYNGKFIFDSDSVDQYRIFDVGLAFNF